MFTNAHTFSHPPSLSLSLPLARALSPYCHTPRTLTHTHLNIYTHIHTPHTHTHTHTHSHHSPHTQHTYINSECRWRGIEKQGGDNCSSTTAAFAGVLHMTRTHTHTHTRTHTHAFHITRTLISKYLYVIFMSVFMIHTRSARDVVSRMSTFFSKYIQQGTSTEFLERERERESQVRDKHNTLESRTLI